MTDTIIAFEPFGYYSDVWTRHDGRAYHIYYYYEPQSDDTGARWTSNEVMRITQETADTREEIDLPIEEYARLDWVAQAIHDDIKFAKEPAEE